MRKNKQFAESVSDCVRAHITYLKSICHDVVQNDLEDFDEEFNGIIKDYLGDEDEQ